MDIDQLARICSALGLSVVEVFAEAERATDRELTAEELRQAAELARTRIDPGEGEAKRDTA
jgi:hypothetical protein